MSARAGSSTSIARWVSILLHPFVTALVLVGAVELPRDEDTGVRSVLAVAILFVMPLVVLTARQVRRGAWGTVDASEPAERPVLFLVGVAGLAALCCWFAVTRTGGALVPATLAVLAMVAVSAVLTRWVKLSLHMAAAAMAAAVLLTRGMALGWCFLALLPVLGWSRVALGRHRWHEVLAGLLIGAVTGVRIGLQ